MPTLEDIPITNETARPMTAELEEQLVADRVELERLGVKVVGIHLAAKGAPPRFFIEFAPNAPSYRTRGNLEKNHFDVGQQMGETMLRFYASRRTIPTGSWD